MCLPSLRIRRDNDRVLVLRKHRQPRPILVLRNEAGTVGSDPCRCVIFADEAVVEQQA